MSENSSNGGGMGLFSGMFLLFLGLKLTGYISWSWWLVTAPLWGGLLVILALILLAVALK